MFARLRDAGYRTAQINARRDDDWLTGGMWAEYRRIILDGWKLVHNFDRPEGVRVPELELFDHRNVPLDLDDVAGTHPEIVDRLKAQLDPWHAYALSEKLPSNAVAGEAMSSEELDRLRSLGYVQ